MRKKQRGVMTTLFGAIPGVLVAAPPPNDNIITNAKSTTALTTLQNQVSTLQGQMTIITTAQKTKTVATGSTLGKTVTLPTLGIATAYIVSKQFGTGISVLTISLPFSSYANVILDISGVTSATELELDLSATGIATTGGSVAPTFQRGFIQIMWPQVTAVTHTLKIVSPFVLGSGGTTADLSSVDMVIYSYVIAPVAGSYGTVAKVTNAAAAIYLTQIIPQPS